MGDSVTVSSAKKNDDFIVSGIFQSTADTGMTFSMNFDSAENLGIDTDNKYRYYIIEDKSQANAIAGEIENEFGENVSVSVYDEESDSEMQMYNTIILIMKILIYAFSLIFAFVVVRMVCTKTFIQERTDIGIFKAIGFTSGRLRLGLAIRFLIVAVTGAVLGAILSAFLSEQILTQLFRLMGTSKVTLDFTAAAVLIPVAAISASFFAFAYLVSRRVKKVAVRELVTE